MKEIIGHVTHYYTHLEVAIVLLQTELNLGDSLVFLGHTTDLTQILCSMELGHHKVTRAASGQTVAIQVDEPVRAGDQVFRLLEGAGDPQNQLLWKGMVQALHGIYHTYQATSSEFERTSGIAENISSILITALTMEPNPISLERLQVRVPYTAAQTYMARLHTAASKDLLLEPEPGEFRLSQFGRQKIQKLITDGRKAMQQADPLPAQASQRLAELLGMLVQSCLFTPPPPDTWSIRLSYQIMPDQEPALPYTEQALSCLSAYRDDCHLAAWQPSELRAQVFETLTVLWRGQAASLDQVYDKLAYRGFARHDYQAALDDLHQHGWIETIQDSIQLTPSGKDFRDQVEIKTDLYFYTPWSCLELRQKTELACLLSALCTGLKLKETV